MLAKMPQGIARLLETFSHRDSAAWHAALPEIPHDVSHDPPEMGKRTGIERNTLALGRCFGRGWNQRFPMWLLLGRPRFITVL